MYRGFINKYDFFTDKAIKIAEKRLGFKAVNVERLNFDIEGVNIIYEDDKENVHYVEISGEDMDLPIQEVLDKDEKELQEEKKETEKKYKQLLKDVEEKEFFKNAKKNVFNCYKCTDCGTITKTKDIDAGVTPASIVCKGCNSLSWSSFYNDIKPNEEHTAEWYRPSLKEVLQLSSGALDHVLKGGLLYRDIR